jgi:predicted tellurium resistance membrane protein TerC
VTPTPYASATRVIAPQVDYFDGDRFTTFKDGARRATPLLLCVVCIELSDFVFAVDSIPAVLAISKDPFIVYSSNILAILGLRSLYVLTAAAITEARRRSPPRSHAQFTPNTSKTREGKK